MKIGLFPRLVAAVLALWLFASAPASVVAQAPTARIAVLGRAPAPAVSPVPGYVAAIVAGFSSAPDAGRQVCITAFVQTLYDSAAWSKIDVLYVFAAGEDQGSRVNWKSPGTFNASKTGTGGTFNTDLGWSTFSSGNLIDSGLNPTTSGGKFLRNDAYLLAATVTDANDVVSTFIAGSAGYTARTSGAVFTTLSQSTSQDTGCANSGKGLYGWNRSTGATYDRWKNGAVFDSPTRSSIALVSANFTIGTHNGTTFTSKTVSLFSAGGGLTSGQHVSFWNGYSAYMACIGQSAT